MPSRRSLKTQWTVVATGTNAVVTATKAAVAGQRHYITRYSVSVRGTTPAVGTFTLNSAANLKDQLELAAAQLPPIAIAADAAPIEGGINEAITASVTGMGATQTATVSLHGYTVAE